MAAGGRGGGGGGSGKAGAIRAGGAYVEIFADDVSVIRALERLKGYLNATGRAMRVAGAATVGAGAAMVAPVAALFTKVVSRDTEMARLANRFGDTVENFSALTYACEATGVSFDAFGEVLENLPERVDDAINGGGEAAEVFKRMGISAQQFMALPLSEKFASLADGLSGFSDDSKNSILGKLFSDKGQAFRELMDGGSAGVRRLMAEANTVGAVVTSQDAANAMKVNAAMMRAWAAAKGVAYSIGAALLPEASAITKASEWVVKAAASVREFVAENKRMVMGVILGGIAIMAIGGTLIGLGYGLSLVAIAVGGIAKALIFVKFMASTAVGSLLAVKAAIAVLGFLISPLGLGVLAVAAALGLAAYAAKDTETAAAAVGELTQAWGFLKTTALDTWGGIRDAVSAGDLNLAFKIAVQGLTVLWTGFVQQATAKWNGFKGFFVDAWHDAIMLFRLGWNGAQAAVGDGFLAMLQAIATQFESTFTRLFEMAASAAEAVGLSGLAGELGMFADLGKKGQLSGVFGEARRDLAKESQQESFAITNGRQEQQARSDAARSADLAAADADLAAAKAELAASIAQAKTAAETAKAAAKLPDKALGKLGGMISELSRGAQGARNFASVFSAGDKVNEKILGANLKNGEKIDGVKDAIKAGFAGMTGTGLVWE